MKNKRLWILLGGIADYLARQIVAALTDLYKRPIG